jgi:hypothetical protein
VGEGKRALVDTVACGAKSRKKKKKREKGREKREELR